MSESDAKQDPGRLPTASGGSGVPTGRAQLGWTALWFVVHMTTYYVADRYFVDAGGEVGFAMMMYFPMMLLLYAAVGMLASLFVAQVTRKTWTFYAGAVVVGIGIGVGLLLPGPWDFFFIPLGALALAGAVIVFRDWLRQRRERALSARE